MGKEYKEAGVQTVSLTKDYISIRQLSEFRLESEMFPRVVQKSHTVFILFLLVVVLFYNAVQTLQEDQTREEELRAVSLDSMENNPILIQNQQWLQQFILNTQKGLLFGAMAVLTYAMLWFKDSYFQRPHPSFWRILNGISLLYLLCLSVLLFQNKHDLQFFLKTFFDHELGVQLQEKDYVQECDVFTPPDYSRGINNVLDKMDVYVCAHLFGWWGKMVIIRDVRFVMFLSCFFELLELTFRFWLPNFHECWWDSLLLDVLGCNLLGIVVGYYTLKWLNMKTYRWGLEETQSTQPPSHWKRLFRFDHLPFLHWNMFQSAWRFLCVLWYVVFVNAVDMSNFFNKAVLNIPSDHFLAKYRVYFWGWNAVIATREYYEYLEDPQNKRIGAQCWLAHLILAVEWLLFFKFYENQFAEPMPTSYIVLWGGILGGIVMIAVCLYLRDCRREREKTKEE